MLRLGPGRSPNGQRRRAGLCSALLAAFTAPHTDTAGENTDPPALPWGILIYTICLLRPDTPRRSVVEVQGYIF